jgi:hypothetical protein
VLAIICDTLERILYGARPIDKTSLVVELFVLALIAYEIVSSKSHGRKLRRRLKIVYKCFVEGQALYQDLPTQGTDEQTVKAWRLRVTGWNNATNEQLCRYSQRVSASFLQDHTHRFGELHPFLAQGAQQEFRLLKDRLDNLRAIMESPDAYFA